MAEKQEDNYCQLTSSKVLVEDLVTDAMDDEHHREFHEHENNAEKPGTTRERRQFWDRPIPLESMAWPGDTRMPLEWNMLMNDQRGMEAHPPHIMNNG